MNCKYYKGGVVTEPVRTKYRYIYDECHWVSSYSAAAQKGYNEAFSRSEYYAAYKDSPYVEFLAYMYRRIVVDLNADFFADYAANY